MKKKKKEKEKRYLNQYGKFWEGRDRKGGNR